MAVLTCNPPLRAPGGGDVAAGVAAIGLALLFNLPFARLAAVFDYPGILRQPPAEVLVAMAEGGAGLVLTWYAFALSALVMVPVAMALALPFVGRRPGLAVAAALLGALAGLVQAVGLFRWVFVVPELAGMADREMAAGLFVALHAYGGVALGEHMGQLLTAGFLGVMAVLQAGLRRWRRHC